MGTAIVQMMGKAEKISTTKLQPGQDPKAVQKEIMNEVDDAIIVFIRARMEFHRLLSRVEAKIQGKAEEMEALETYIRTQPKLGNHSRKRKLQQVAQQQQQQQPDGGSVPETLLKIEEGT
jgi:hypothetical protein